MHWEDPIRPHALMEKISHAGQSFRLTCLTSKDTGGLTPRLFKDRPTDGATWHADFMLGAMGADYAEGYLGA